MTWAGLLVASAACYALKLAGLSLPQRVLGDARVQRTVPLLPVALLAALVATQTFSSGQHLVFDGPRTTALGVAILAVLLRAPFLVVVVAAAATAALLRLV